jgi:hypothetical protein
MAGKSTPLRDQVAGLELELEAARWMLELTSTVLADIQANHTPRPGVYGTGVMCRTCGYLHPCETWRVITQLRPFLDLTDDDWATAMASWDAPAWGSLRAAVAAPAGRQVAIRVPPGVRTTLDRVNLGQDFIR